MGFAIIREQGDRCGCNGLLQETGARHTMPAGRGSDEEENDSSLGMLPERHPLATILLLDP